MTPTNEEPDGVPRQEEGEPHRNDERWPQRTMAVFTVLSFLATAAYVGVSSRQLIIMTKALDSNERAWIWATPPTNLVLVPNQSGQIDYRITNYGKSPAFDVSLRTLITPGPPPPRLTREAGQTKYPLTPLGGHSDVTRHLTPSPTATVEDIKSGTRPVFVWIEVIYADTFNKNRYTRQCYRWLANVEPGKGAWAPCGEIFE